jgi:hypothetical protein
VLEVDRIVLGRLKGGTARIRLATTTAGIQMLALARRSHKAADRTLRKPWRMLELILLRSIG